MAKCICTRCKADFKSVKGFDMHLVGKLETYGKSGGSRQRCLSANEMLAKGMCRNERGEWVSRLLTKETVEIRRQAG